MDLETRRSRSARHYLVDGPLTARLETLLTLVSQTVDFPAVRVNIVDEDTQHTISLFGAGDPSAVARTQAFCSTVVETELPVIVNDAARDPRFAHLDAVISGDIGSYLGVPLRGREAMVIGAVCVIDPATRTIDDGQLERLTEFGRVVEDQLDLIRRLMEQRLEGEVATDEIARAVRDGEIVPWYQPIVDLGSGELVGFEALARWEHPERGVDDPRRFIPVAEDSDLIIDVDLAVIRRALVDLRQWQQLHPDIRMSVNLSARHLVHPESAVVLHQAVLDAGITPESVTLELTETSRVDTANVNIAAVVHQLRAIGFQVWLDDFGTGWSSLDHLLWLSVDGIKIDRAVAVALGTPVGDALTSAVTGLAAALHLKTTIEGVETTHHSEHARGLGCDYGQGYLWGPPTAASSVTFAPRAVNLSMVGPLDRGTRIDPSPPPDHEPTTPTDGGDIPSTPTLPTVAEPAVDAAPRTRFDPDSPGTSDDHAALRPPPPPITAADTPLSSNDSEHTAMVLDLLDDYRRCFAQIGTARRRSLTQALTVALHAFWALRTTRVEQHLSVQNLRLTRPDLMVTGGRIGDLPARWAQWWLQEVSAVQGVRWTLSTAALGRLVVATLDGLLVDFIHTRDRTGVHEMIDVFAFHLSQHATRRSGRRPPGGTGPADATASPAR